jgi:tRNA (cmo5U34)-methyltransferase
VTDVPEIFEQHAGDYEAQRRRLLPGYDAFYGEAVYALELAERAPRRILDLGAGTGLLARAVLDAHPDAELTLLDGAPAMLAQARAALGDRASYITAVVSALAIHHLDEATKGDLFASVHIALAPGGVLINADQFSGPNALFDDTYAAWHEQRATELGASPAEWRAARERMSADRCTTVECELGLLRAAGLEADCLFKDHCFAVLVAKKSSDE